MLKLNFAKATIENILAINPRLLEELMGSLIQTKGTKLLAAHFNEEFSTHIDFYRTAATKALFNSSSGAYTSLYNITCSLTSTDANHTRRTDGKTLLPDINPGDHRAPGFRHPNLELRWLWFLQSFLLPANDKAIAAGIFAALNDTSYSSITFSCVEGVAQSVTATSANDGGTKYQQIVLTTQVMPTASPAPGVPGIDLPNN